MESVWQEEREFSSMSHRWASEGPGLRKGSIGLSLKQTGPWFLGSLLNAKEKKLGELSGTIRLLF